MTALISINHVDGQCYIAADSRISWGSDPGYPRKDNLQKLYGLAPNVVVGICGDLRPARSVLVQLERWVQSRGVERLLRCHRRDAARWLLAAAFSAWKTRRLHGRVYLALGVVEKSVPTVFHWSSIKSRPSGKREEWSLSPIAPGQVKIHGSVLNDPSLVEILRDRLTAFATRSGLRPGDRDALLHDTLTSVLANRCGEKVQVGGLFQVASEEDGVWCVSGFAASKVCVGECGYEVGLRVNPGGWLEQIDSAGSVLRLKDIKQASFSPPRGRTLEFRY